MVLGHSPSVSQKGISSTTKESLIRPLPCLDTKKKRTTPAYEIATLESIVHPPLAPRVETAYDPPTPRHTLHDTTFSYCSFRPKIVTKGVVAAAPWKILTASLVALPV